MFCNSGLQKTSILVSLCQPISIDINFAFVSERLVRQNNLATLKQLCQLKFFEFHGFRISESFDRLNLRLPRFIHTCVLTSDTNSIDYSNNHHDYKDGYPWQHSNGNRSTKGI